MPAPAWEKLDAFFSVDEFAIEAIITPQVGAVRTVSGILDTPYLQADLGEHEIDTEKVQLTVRATDAEGLRRGDQVACDGRTFRLTRGPVWDGTGLAVLHMTER